MKKSYLISDFERTVAADLPERAQELNAALDARLQTLRRENAGTGKKVQFHLESQILPGIAVYETLQTVMPKDKALEVFHGYVEERAHKLKKIFLGLMRIPGMYRRAPGIFSKLTPEYFGEAAGFAAHEIQTAGGVWRIDMTKCPYHDTWCGTAVPNCATAFATVTISHMTDCIRSSAGVEQRHWGAGTTAVTSALRLYGTTKIKKGDKYVLG